jgi:2-polyprenyl-6-methoxyphenol hydroxylase-like FAD-dependent oxidoreductase
MNLGIQDAFALAAALPGGEGAVDAWAAERHAVARRVLVATDVATRLFVATGRVGERLRPGAFSLLVRFPALMRRIERGLAGMAYPPVPD